MRAPGEAELAERYRSLVDTANDAIVVITAGGIIDSVNPAAERMFGYAHDELIGKNVSVLMPEPFRSEHDGYIRRYLDTGETRVIGAGREVIGRRRDGEVFPVRLSVGEMRIGGRRMFTGILHNLEERRDLEDELGRVQAKLGALAQEAALRRVATAVAAEAPMPELMDLVAEEVRRLLDVEVGLVLALTEEGPRVAGAALGDLERPPADAGATALEAGVDITQRARVVPLELLPEGPVREWTRRTGLRTAVTAPVDVHGRPWGTIVAASRERRLVHPAPARMLADFAALATLAIGNASSREHLRRLATTDSLTGLANHRSFHETLAQRVAEAEERDSRLALAIFDVDLFKSINDGFGHQAGDHVLKEIGACLRAVARQGDTVARIGGEEFAWLMPGADARTADGAAQRLRQRLAQTPFPGFDREVTLSGGICSLQYADSPGDLVQLADRAMYWAKAHGRNRVVRYEPGLVDTLSPDQQADRLLAQQKLRSLRMIARAIDARDHATRCHSERVADLAVALAVALGWGPVDCARLREAGLVHDVGKIGVPDAILMKPGPLTADERTAMEAHVTIGVEMLREVLDPDQLDWIRGHHERWSGGGYPDDLAGEQINEGARILCLADSWDVMTSSRVYKRARSIDDAARECCAMAGSQFWPAGVDALLRLIEARALPGQDHPDEIDTRGLASLV